MSSITTTTGTTEVALAGEGDGPCAGYAVQIVAVRIVGRMHRHVLAVCMIAPTRRFSTA